MFSEKTIQSFQQVIPHELYAPREKYYDIALLLLARTVKFYDHIWPACLHNSKMLVDDQMFAISGWKRNGIKANMLLKSELDSLTNSQCQEYYSDKRFAVSMPNGITDNLFCSKPKDCKSTNKLTHLF